jgi:two-component system phosphate regulon sensor histidine kinase PhoR
LARSLNEMADELQLKIESMKKMDRVRTDFVANVSHELKTPLTSIKGFIETLEDGAINDKANAERFLSIIKKHAERLNSIINDLLSLTELELGKDRIENSRFSLKDLLDEVILGFGHTLSVKQLSLNLNAKGNDFNFMGDRSRIEQVFVNLIDNAIKYTKIAGNVKISLFERKSDFLITVEDNGIGISKEHLERVFERFYTADKARSRELGGTGLGLSIVKHIISLHNGSIDIVSEVDEGTKVTLVLSKQ